MKTARCECGGEFVRSVDTGWVYKCKNKKCGALMEQARPGQKGTAIQMAVALYGSAFLCLILVLVAGYLFGW